MRSRMDRADHWERVMDVGAAVRDDMVGRVRRNPQAGSADDGVWGSPEDAAVPLTDRSINQSIESGLCFGCSLEPRDEGGNRR